MACSRLTKRDQQVFREVVVSEREVFGAPRVRLDTTVVEESHINTLAASNHQMYRWDVGSRTPLATPVRLKEKVRGIQIRTHALPEAVQLPYRVGQDEAYPYRLQNVKLKAISLRCDSAILIQNEHYEYIELLQKPSSLGSYKNHTGGVEEITGRVSNVLYRNGFLPAIYCVHTFSSTLQTYS
jgi:hypothetical protein